MDFAAITGWVLFIMASTNGGQSVTISTDLWFPDEAACRAAAKTLTEQPDFKVFATCIEVPNG